MESSQAAPPSRQTGRVVVTWFLAGLAGSLVSGLIFIVLNSGPTEIQAAVVARGYTDAGGASGAGTTFSPQDNPLHCVVSLVRAGKGTKVKISWIAVEAGGQQNYKLLDRELEMNGQDSTIDAYLTLQQPWPTGSYKIEIYLDGRLARTLFFNISETVRVGAGAYILRSFQ